MNNHKKIAAALLAAGLATFGQQLPGAPLAAVARADDELITPESGHKSGYYGWNSVQLGEDAVDTRTDETHQCAGRTLLYQAHTDAIYGTRNNGVADVMVVDGQVPRPADDVCLRLGPDANGSGEEISRFVVPDQKKFEFLGKPGTILWHAPQAVDWKDDWRPLWAGIGAFDPSHEYEVPEEFENNEVTFDLVDFDGPGDMETFWTNASSSTVDRMLSTKDGITSFAYEVGFHGHFGWTFTNPGIYTMTVKMSGVHKDTGEVEESPERTITWLVGSDEQVGLEEGTTKRLRQIKKSAEDMREEMGLEEPGADDPGDDSGEGDIPENPGEGEEPGDNPGEEPGDEPEDDPIDDPESGDDSGDENSDQPNDPGAGTGSRSERAAAAIAKAYPNAGSVAIIDHGHMDLAMATENGRHRTFLKDGTDPVNVVERPSGTFGFLIDSSTSRMTLNDQVLSTIRAVNPAFGKDVHVSPLAQQEDPNSPWLGFSTDAVDYNLLDREGAILSIREFEGPGEMVTTHSTITGVQVELSSNDLTRTVPYPAKSHDHQSFVFSEEGVYRVVFEYSGTGKDGKKFSIPLETYFVVGDVDPSDAPGAETPGNGEVPAPDNPGSDKPDEGNPGTDNPGQENPGQDNPGQQPGPIEQIVAPKPGFSLTGNITIIISIGVSWICGDGNATAADDHHGRHDVKDEQKDTQKGTQKGDHKDDHKAGGKNGGGVETPESQRKPQGGKPQLGKDKGDTSGGSAVPAPGSKGGSGSHSAAIPAPGGGGSAPSSGSATTTSGSASGSTPRSTNSSPSVSHRGGGASSATSGGVHNIAPRTLNAPSSMGRTSRVKTGNAPQSGDKGQGIRKLPSISADGANSQNTAAEGAAQEKSTLQALGKALSQGGWIGGFTLGIGIMALLGGMILVLLANRNLSTARKLQRKAIGED